MIRRTARFVLPIAVLLTFATPAAARPDATRSALATERYYSSYAPSGASRDAALATERYYSSYGTPETLASRVAPAPAAADSGPTWTAAILVGSLAMLAAAGLGLLAGRAGRRPRHAGA